MKQLFLITFILISVLTVKAQEPQDRIIGTWLIDTKEAKVEMFKRNGKYFGKIVWMKEPNGPQGTPKTDKNNPDKVLRGRKILGMENLSDLQYKKGRWINGTLYSAKRGMYLDCETEMSKNGKKLYITINKGWFSKTLTWTRI